MTTWPKRDKDGRHITSVEVEVECEGCDGEGWYYCADESGYPNKEQCHECKGTGKVKCQ
jgi:DnaJ-class molecular chaperone